MAVLDIRYRRLGYLALTVTDLDRSERFYRDVVGTTVTRSPAGDVLFVRVSDRHHDLALARGENAGLKRIGWEMESSAAVAAARAHLGELGIATTPVPDAEAAVLGITDAFRAVEPTSGVMFEFYVDMAPAPPFEPTHTQIARLGHVVLGSPRKTETEQFLVDELNFRISDRIGPVVTFMRCFPNPFHHSFGVSGGAVASLGHVNFMVTNIDDIGRANIRMKKSEVPVVFGPGRHPTSNSIFFYFLDPDGITVEYSFGMEEFPEVGARDAREFPVLPESFDEWGGQPDTTLQRLVPIEA